MARQPNAEELRYTPIISCRSGQLLIQTKQRKGKDGEIAFPATMEGAKQLGTMLGTHWQNWFWSISVDMPESNNAPKKNWRRIISVAANYAKRERVSHLLEQ